MTQAIIVPTKERAAKPPVALHAAVIGQFVEFVFEKWRAEPGSHPGRNAAHLGRPRARALACPFLGDASGIRSGCVEDWEFGGFIPAGLEVAFAFGRLEEPCA